MATDPDQKPLDFAKADRLHAEHAVRQASAAIRSNPDMRFLSRQALYYAALRFLAGAAFPRLTRRLSWPRRLGPRSLVLYTLANAAGAHLLRSWLTPHLQEWAVEAEVAKRRLRRDLGREPTDDELVEHLTSERQRASATCPDTAGQPACDELGT